MKIYVYDLFLSYVEDIWTILKAILITILLCLFGVILLIISLPSLVYVMLKKWYNNNISNER